ncbi:MAG: hypothetical protein M1835_004291 [Candelina submexicana]|nr:MAG: hypothetical protein M1835_004291 [Candelina submexicana]
MVLGAGIPEYDQNEIGRAGGRGDIARNLAGNGNDNGFANFGVSYCQTRSSSYLDLRRLYSATSKLVNGTPATEGIANVCRVPPASAEKGAVEEYTPSTLDQTTCTSSR